jgi:hypothetical protein
MNRSSYLIERWETRLSEKSENNLLTARRQLRSMHGILAKSDLGGLKPKDRARLAQAGQAVSEIFSGEHGTAVKAAEVGDK